MIAEFCRDHFSDAPPDPLNWADLPTDPPMPPPMPRLEAPFYVGSVTAAERGAFGPLTLEVAIEAHRSGQVHVGGYVLSAGEAARLARLLTVAAGVLGVSP